MDKKKLIVYRLYDPNYGEEGNKATLSVILREDNTLTYAHFGGRQESGTPYSISNLGMKKSLPESIMSFYPRKKQLFKSVKALHNAIVSCLASGYGSNKIKSFIICNQV